MTVQVHYRDNDNFGPRHAVEDSVWKPINQPATDTAANRHPASGVLLDVCDSFDDCLKKAFAKTASARFIKAGGIEHFHPRLWKEY
jgi:hypothetical protein